MRDTCPLRPISSFFLCMSVCSSLSGCSSEAPIRDHRSPPTIEHTPPAPVEIRVDDPSMIQYTLRFPGHKNHYIDVEGVFPVTDNTLELSMAVWTPGSYKVREYSRHVEDIRAMTPAGKTLDIVKASKNRWRVQTGDETGDARRVAVRYRVYGRELTVRTNYIDDAMAMLNGAPTFLTTTDGKPRPFDITLELPAGWTDSVTALDPHPSGTPHRYLAADYDTVVDSPIIAGTPTLHKFDVQGIPHVLANVGEGDVWDGPRSAKDVETLTRAHIEFWGEIPYRRYYYLNVLWEAGGGLEHKQSTLMLASRFDTRERKRYERWLGLVSHEFFHTWNIKRMRPSTLGPFDYETENYTHSLWIAEGITSYYDVLMLRRAGLIDDEAYLELLSEEIRILQTRPGRAVQSLTDSSFDAWIKYYRPNENSANTSISYYNKGALVAFFLDIEIREATQNARTLDDVLRLMYKRYSGDKGFTPDDFRATVAEVAGKSLASFFTRYVDGTDELDYGRALSFYGLRFEDEDDDEEPYGYLGAITDSHGNITKVLRDTPAYNAGLEYHDELIAIGDYRVPGDGLTDRLKRYRPGEDISVLVARRGRLHRLTVTLTEPPDTSFQLEFDPDANALARSRRARWLNGDR